MIIEEKLINNNAEKLNDYFWDYLKAKNPNSNY